MKSIDRHYRALGYTLLCGVDEAGRGPWAGPVYCAAVILSEKHRIRGIDDSKKLSPQKREDLFQQITDRALTYSIVALPNTVIDRSDILKATKLGMRQAVLGLKMTPEFLLIDALNLNVAEIPQMNLIHGDARSESIAAASILAKVSRDRYMCKMHVQYPHYNFAENKGYGTKEHQIALQQYGPCPLHRLSFAPLKALRQIPEVDPAVPTYDVLTFNL